MRNTGQTCYISTRILAPASRYDEVVDMVTATIAAGKQGDPLDAGHRVRPVRHGAQYRTVLEYVESGLAEGARATTGGAPRLIRGLEHGYFVEPTVFADVTPDMRIAREEIFGPVITHPAVQRPSTRQWPWPTTPSSVSAGWCSASDPAAAMDVADRMDTGSVGINFFASNHAAPFGGRHDSGLGTEYGIEGLNAYLSYKSIHRRA